jgi:hypothetical protein
MLLTDYTTYDDIRAVLGVTDKEVSDATVALEVYSMGVAADLRDIKASGVATTLDAKYSEVKAVNLPDRTSDQQEFYENARSFALYAAARLLATSLPMFGPKDISDSKTLISRFSTDPYKETTKRVEFNFNLNRTRLLASFNKVTAAGNPPQQRNLFAVSSPSTDRVTG